MALLESKHRVMDFSKKMLLLVILSISVHNCLSEDTRLYFEPRTNEHSKLNNWDSSSLRFASYYGDHMVLQQAPKKSIVWGYADTEHIGKVVTIRLLAVDGTHESTYQTTVEKENVNGNAVWSVQLNPRPAGGPYNLTVSVHVTTLVLTDVLFGDIWLCGGQSNMEFSVPMMFEEMVDLEYSKSEKYENIRVFTAALESSTVPLYDLKSVMEKWSRPSPDVLGKGQKSFTYFSATCWIFGRRLYETLGYPIGLLESDWGGTPDEAWMSPDALKQCGLDTVQESIKRTHADRTHYATLNAEEYQRCCAGPGQNSVLWNAMIHPLLNLTITGAIWYQGEADSAKTNYYCTFPVMISDWRSKFHIGTKGETDPTFPFGFVQLYKEMMYHEYNISKHYPDVRLFLVNIKASATPLIDFASVGLKWSKPSPQSLKGFAAVCWLFGRHLQETLNYPIGLITSAVGGTPDEAWSSLDALHKCGINHTVEYQKISKPSYMSWEQYQAYLKIPQGNSVLWNAMIHPLLNLTIHGTIWYQGEADSGKSNYFCTFPAMISDWRLKFHAGTRGETDLTFPFGFVQLGPNQPPAPGNITAGYPSIRWQQTAKYGFVPNARMPNTFMAVALDLADFDSPYGGVHYQDKETVGTRLALSGLAQAYQIPTKYKGPMPTSISMSQSGTMTITYDNGETPLNVRNTWGFELCCPTDNSEGKCDYDIYGSPWNEAQIIGHDSSSVTISTKNCTEMTALRYIWRVSPCEYKLCPVYSVDNELPAPPHFIKKSQLERDLNGDFTVTW